MLGSIVGDCVGSVFEFSSNKNKSEEFPLYSSLSTFTDDTIMTLAVAKSILHKEDLAVNMRKFGLKYHDRGYGGMFARWLKTASMGPYNSFGNGSAMRVSPVGFAFNDPVTVLAEAKKTAEVSHNHPEGIKGAQAIALAIYMARTESSKEDIKRIISSTFDYNLDRKIADIRPTYKFNETCQGSVPESIIAFLESNSFEDCIRKAISLGGDADTMACIAGGIAQAYYKKIPKSVYQPTVDLLSNELLDILNEFNERYHIEWE
jgi:ADP-ribosylglycohydrolase